MVINKILERKNYLKRPKVSNISRMLDKGLCLAEFLGISPIIVINKTDLDEKESDRILNLYTKSGYKVIKTKAEKGEGIDKLREELKGHVSVLSRKFWGSENLQLQIRF